MSSPRFEVSFEDLVWLRYDETGGLLEMVSLVSRCSFVLLLRWVRCLYGKVTFLFFSIFMELGVLLLWDTGVEFGKLT